MSSEVIHPEIHIKKPVPEVTYVSGLLFHGARKPFEYSSSYQFNDPSNDGSLTLGEGIYLTDNIEHATDYSEVRQSVREYQPVVYSVSAEQCKFLDFRGEQGNVPVPKEIIVKWRDYFKEDLEQQKKEKPDVGPEREIVEVLSSDFKRIKINWAYLERQDLEKYLAYLDELVATNVKVDVRELIGTAPINGSKTEFKGKETAPRWSRLFRFFVSDVLHFDGFIVLEAAEGKLQGLHPSFVVYNLASIQFSQKTLHEGNSNFVF